MTDWVIEQKYKALLCALDKIELGLCILNVESLVIEKNSEARRLLKNRCGIALSDDDKFACTDNLLNLKLRRLLQAVCGLDRTDPNLSDPVIVIRKKNGINSLLIEVSSLSGLSTPVNGQGELALLMLVDLLRPNPLSISRAISIYGLTDAEAAICQLLIEGNTTSQMAAVRNVSIETVRSQIKSILRKTQCTRRIDLISRVFSIAPPVKI